MQIFASRNLANVDFVYVVKRRRSCRTHLKRVFRAGKVNYDVEKGWENLPSRSWTPSTRQ